MLVRLFVTNDKSNVKKVVLRSDTTIGRSSDCNLRIASQEVSRQHCTILVGDDYVAIRDHGSSNGTYLNGELIEPNRDVPLASESEVEIGNVRFRVQHDVPMQFPGSTAEVPNAAVAAGVGEPAQRTPTVAVPVAQPVDAAPDEPDDEDSEAKHRPDSQETIRDVYVDETLNEQDASESERQKLADAETISKELDEEKAEAPAEFEAVGPDDTVAFDLNEQAPEDGADPATDIYDDSQIAAFQQSIPEPEETVSMNAADLDFSEPAIPIANPVVPPAGEDDSSSEPAGKKSGLKSLFGFLGRKKKDDPPPKTEQLATTPTDLNTDETLRDDSAAYDEEVREESFGESPDEDLDQTLRMPDDEEYADDEELDDEPAAEGEQITVFPEGEPDEAEEPAGDTDENLQDFFKQLSQD